MLAEEFIDPGLLKVQIVVTPLKKYPNSALEASTLLCAAKQNKGVAMHQRMHELALRDRKTLIAAADKLAVGKTFTPCLVSQETKDALAKQAEMIAALNVTLIPAFFMNDESIVGLPTYTELRGWINAKLSSAPSA